MTRAQADAIAQAILQPGQHAQQRHLRRERQAAWLLRRRRVAAITVAGCGLGAAAAWLSAIGFSQGVLYGGLTGAALGWLLDARRNA